MRITESHYNVMLKALMLAHLQPLPIKAKDNNGNCMVLAKGNYSVWYHPGKENVLIRSLANRVEWNTETDDMESIAIGVSRLGIPIIIE